MQWLSNFVARFTATPVSLNAEQQARLAAWQALPPVDLGQPFAAARYVVVDVESSGLNVHRDRLIAIGATAIQGGRVAIGDSLEMVLKQDVVSTKDNILVHGISGEAQREGLEPVEGLLQFLEYLGKDPLIAYHVGFDNIMISKTLRKYLGLKFEHPWADLAHVAPSVLPEFAATFRSLDHWTVHFNIGNFARHSALADALATAQLMLTLKDAVEARGIENFKKLRDVYLAHQRVTRSLGG